VPFGDVSRREVEAAVKASAVIVIDMLNHYEHADAGPLMVSVGKALPGIRRILDRAAETESPVVYVNDNHGDWSAGRAKLAARAMAGAAPSLVESIIPGEDVPLLLKSRHSIFYQTQLECLLGQYDIGRLVLVGQVTEQCVLYSGLDAYIRDFEIAVPRDAVAHIHSDLGEAALEMMGRNMRAEIPTSRETAL
jgi:nicotinamidase-related amidase